MSIRSLQIHKRINLEILTAIGLIVFALGSRFIPHDVNFSPVLAIALFAGAAIGNVGLAVLVPVLAIFLSDLVLGMYAGIEFVYVSYAVVALMGVAMRTARGVPSISIALNSILAAVVFFAISNFGVWISTDMYEKSWAGLSHCFIAAIPFFHNTVLSTLVTAFALFAAFAFMRARVLQKA